MKKLSVMNNVEKAKLLHQLLPDSIPAFLNTVEHLSKLVKAQEEDLIKNWDAPILSAQMWVRLAEDTTTVLKNYRKQLEKNSNVFADQLFDGYNALFVNHCITLHAKLEDTDRAFKNAFELMYGRD